MPRASRGAKPLIEAALFAASGEAIPSITPVPNFSGCLEMRFSARYARNEAVVIPPAGIRPMKSR